MDRALISRKETKKKDKVKENPSKGKLKSLQEGSQVFLDNEDKVKKAKFFNNSKSLTCSILALRKRL